jgi:hypothetical protein
MTFELDPKRAVLNSYGVRTTKSKFGGVLDDDVIKTAAWTFTYDDLPAWGSDKLEHLIPAYAKVLEARFEVLTAFAGGTSLSVGLARSSDGVAIDVAGFVTAAQGALANINTRGQFITGSGALINASVGANAGELTVTATGTFTAGKARVLIRYAVEGV